MIRKAYTYLLVVMVAMVFSNNASAQQDSTNEEFIIGNKIYKGGSSWLKISQGMGYHFWLGQVEYNTTIAYSFRIKKLYFQFGYHVSSDKFFTKPSLQKLNDIYGCIGKRKEQKKYNLAYFIGLSYAYGATLDHREWNNGVISNWYRGFAKPGLLGTIDYTYKLSYDIGIGLSLYGSVNPYYNVLGVQLHFYLSGAYKGQIE